jgi:hypothetical protein
LSAVPSIAPALPLNLQVTSSNPSAVRVVDATTAAGGTARITGGPVPGTATITVSDPGGVYLPATLQVSEPPQAQLSFPSPAYNTQAGATVQIQVAIAGSTVSTQAQAANGTQVALTPYSPTGVKLATRLADTANGTATFSLTEDEAGNYKLYAVAWGCQAPAAPAVLAVQAGPAVALSAQLNPSPFLLPGHSANVWAALVDKYGNPTDSFAQAQVSLLSGNAGTLAGAGGSLAGGAAIGSFRATAPGTAEIQVTSPGYQPVNLPIRVVATPAQIVDGKGMWLLYGTWRETGDAPSLADAAAQGITHIYLEVATTNDGLYGGPALDDFLAKAHANGIAVIAWV